MLRFLCGIMLVSQGLYFSCPALAEDKNVEISENRRGNTITLTATLVNCTEVTITITGELTNMHSSPSLPLTVDAAGRTRLVLATFVPDNSRNLWRYTWHFHWIPGRRLKNKPKEYIYSLPYTTGSFRVAQGRLGSLSHQIGSQDEEAIDWSMPVGTIICAARPGVVVGLRQDCRGGGPDIKWKPDYNYVTIRHEDGTFAEYAHISPNGVLLHLGDKVALSQPIALSGMAGYATGPHLHFAIFYAIDGNTRLTLPVLFKNRVGKTVTMQEGSTY